MKKQTRFESGSAFLFILSTPARIYVSFENVIRIVDTS